MKKSLRLAAIIGASSVAGFFLVNGVDFYRVENQLKGMSPPVAYTSAKSSKELITAMDPVQSMLFFGRKIAYESYLDSHSSEAEKAKYNPYKPKRLRVRVIKPVE